MTKIETIIFEYEHCGECPCALVEFETGEGECDRGECRRIIPDLWGDIPDWCPLETKEEECQK